MSITTAYANSILDLIFNQGTLSVSTLYISLHTADPGQNGANEVSGGSYSRMVATTAFSSAADGQLENVSNILFEDMPGVTVTHAGVWTAETAGSFIWSGALDEEKIIAAGDDARFKSGDIVFSIT